VAIQSRFMAWDFSMAASGAGESLAS